MHPPQQILHVVADMDGYGLTRQLELLVRQQLHQRQEVRVVALAAARDAVASLRQLGVDCRILDRRWRRDPIAAFRFARELRRRSTDILHLWGRSALDYLSVIRRIPWITTLGQQTRIVSPRSGRVSPGIALPGPANRSRQQFLDQQCLPDDSILIAVAGPLTRAQQIDEAIWYFELVRTLDERVRLLIFGDGPERHRLERFSRLAAEPSAIRFLGYRTDFRELLPHADLFWQTAVADDALPLTMLEAMAAGVPVVANENPLCRQVITNGENSYLVPDKDRAAFARQTLRLIQDAKQAEQISARAAQMIAEHFSVETMTQAYASLYAELAS